MKQKPLIQKDISTQEAIEFLQKSGYTVTKDLEDNGGISNFQLIEIFRENLAAIGGEDDVLSSCLDDRREIEAIKKFKKKASVLNIKPKDASEYLRKSILLMFKYMEDLELEKPPSSIYFLLSEKGSWILKKTLQVHRKKMEDSEVEFREKMYNDDDDRFLQKRKELHKKILARKKVNDG